MHSKSQSLNFFFDFQEIRKKPQKINPAAFLFSDDEGDEKRVVRSAKEKRYEALFGNIKTIKNCKKTRDFNQMLSSFTDLQTNFDKAKPIIKKEENGVTPRFFLRILVEMEDLVNETWEDSAGRKSLSKINGKSLGALRQKLRKYIRDVHDEDVAAAEEEVPLLEDVAEHLLVGGRGVLVALEVLDGVTAHYLAHHLAGLS